MFLLLILPQPSNPQKTGPSARTLFHKLNNSSSPDRPSAQEFTSPGCIRAKDEGRVALPFEKQHSLERWQLKMQPKTFST